MCVEADLDSIVELSAKHAAYEKAQYSSQGKKEGLREALFAPNPVLNCLVVDVDGKLVGYATYTFDFSTWDAQKFIYLDCLYLEDDHRSYGIGAVLMDKVKQAGQDVKCINMQWQTPDFNVRAIKFYDRIGGTGKNKVRYTLRLAQ